MADTAPWVTLSCQKIVKPRPPHRYATPRTLLNSSPSRPCTEYEVMVSLDVVSLFTCVPTNLVVQVARRRLENDPTLPKRIDLSVCDIVDLLTLCLNATFLQFRGKMYQQIHGTAMGSPISVVVANLVMEDVEVRALTTFHSPPRFWRHYVDDTFTAFPHGCSSF